MDPLMDPMAMEGLRWGMLLGGAVMAAPPVAVGVAITVFLLREYRRSVAEEVNAARTEADNR
jgi:hypothetical protein